MFLPELLTRRRFLHHLGNSAAGIALLSSSGVKFSALAASDVEERLANATGTVRTLLWEGYADAEALAPLMKDGRIELERQFVNQDDVDMIAKRGTYDIGVAVDGIYPALYLAKAMQPLDMGMIPNKSGLLKSKKMFREDTNTPALTVFDDKTYGLPYAFGVLGVTYNADRVGDPPQNLDDFLDPLYTGKLGLGDDGPSVIVHVARHLGLGGTDSLGRSPSPTFLTEEELDQVFAKLEKFKAQTNGIIASPYGEYAGAYARGEIIAAMPDWAPTAVAAQEGGINVQLAVPPEASRTFIDCMFISADVEGSDAMYAFLNQAISEETSYAIGKSLQVGVMNQAALARLASEGPAWSIYGDVDALLSAAPSQQWPPIQSDIYTTHQDWLRRWEKFKAS